MKSLRNLALSLIFLAVISSPGRAQSSPAQAFDNVIIHTADGEVIENGTIIWRNGIIQAVGDNLSIPFDAYTIDGGDSLHVYPGFIDGMALWGSPDLPNSYENPDRPGDPGYERAGIQPQRSPSKLLEEDDKNFEEAQKHGFTTAALGLKGHMLPGQIDLYFINGDETGKYLWNPGIGLLGSFRDAPGGVYPSTTMGVLAEYRQLWYDARALMQQDTYYAASSSDYPAPEKNEVLEALYPVIKKEQPLYFLADSKENIERLFSLQDKLGFEFVLVSGKEAYTKAEELKKREIPVLAGIDLPEKPDWKKKEEKAKEDTTVTEEEKEELTEEMSMFRKRQLEAYKEDINNIHNLIEAGVKVGYASNGLKLSDLKKHMQTLTEETDLTENQLLYLISQQTADILRAGNRIGDIDSGKIASFNIFTKPFIEDESQVLYSISAGKLTEFESKSSK